MIIIVVCPRFKKTLFLALWNIFNWLRNKNPVLIVYSDWIHEFMNSWMWNFTNTQILIFLKWNGIQNVHFHLVTWKNYISLIIETNSWGEIWGSLLS